MSLQQLVYDVDFLGLRGVLCFEISAMLQLFLGRQTLIVLNLAELL